MTQFEDEVKKGSNVRVKDNRVYYEIGNKTYFFEQYQNMIRKRELSGGHQPMLTDIKIWEVSDQATVITFLVEFENGEKNEGIWTKPST